VGFGLGAEPALEAGTDRVHIGYGALELEGKVGDFVDGGFGLFFVKVGKVPDFVYSAQLESIGEEGGVGLAGVFSGAQDFGAGAFDPVAFFLEDGGYFTAVVAEGDGDGKGGVVEGYFEADVFGAGAFFDMAGDGVKELKFLLAVVVFGHCGGCDCRSEFIVSVGERERQGRGRNECQGREVLLGD